MEKDFFFNFINKSATESLESREDIIPNEHIAFTLFPFFIELIGQFKDTLKNLRYFTRIFYENYEKFCDKEFGGYLNRMITEDIKNIELVQNSLINYIRINNPIIKKNTVNTIIEEELKKCQVVLNEKQIKLFKTLEKDLPETVVPDDQLRYILSCILQYVMALMPRNGSFGLFTKSLILQKEKVEDRMFDQKERRYIEILMFYTGYKKPTEQFGAELGIPARQKEGILDLALRLVDQIVQGNQGTMKFEMDDKKEKTTIFLRFPVERRKVVYYQPAKDLGSNLSQSKTTFEKLSSLEEMKKRN